ncbi:metallophosphoesterase [Patescibacteria group bacterium]|jgi:serine/threonine protein phosphatase 1|nr:metallophosphoesterase [Patescibacteria group bacterium]
MKYVIGDLHGNFAALDALVAQLGLQAADELIFLGDYLDKTSGTRETLARLHQLRAKHACTFLLGNHEYVWDQFLREGREDRREFLLHYGGLETLREFDPEPERLLEPERRKHLKDLLKDYLDLISACRPYVIVKGYLAIHAGLKPEQLNQEPLVIEEANFFLRPERMDLEQKYLGRLVVVGGHTHLATEPALHGGYLNIDLGAGYGGYLAALQIEQNTVIRSDGKRFEL